MSLEELIKIRKSICTDYINGYEKNGFISQDSLPLASKDDLTLDFTTCTICVAKPFIRKNLIGDDYVMIQPAMRNTHIKSLGKINSRLPFISCFTMMGGFKYYNSSNEGVNSFDDVVNLEFTFLRKYFDNIILTLPVQYEEFMPISDQTKERLMDDKCTIKYSLDDMENLKWKYGIANVTGYGTRWELVNDDQIINWGNTINVFRNDKPYGADFGGGLESFICAYKNLDSPIYANKLFNDDINKSCGEDQLNEKIFDCIASILCIVANKEKIVLRDRYVLEQYLRLLVSLEKLTDKTKEEIMFITKGIISTDESMSKSNNLINVFNSYYSKASNNYDILSNSLNIDEIVNLISLCYNGKESWLNNKKITSSHYRKYFTNLSEIELLSLFHSKMKEKEEKSNLAKKIKRRN